MSIRLLALVSFLLLFSVKDPVDRSWGERMVDWFSSLLWGEASVPQEDQEPVSAVLLEALAEVPGSDTLQTRHGWPVLSLDVAGDLAVQAKLREAVALVEDSLQAIPVRPAGGIRIIYREGERPEYLIEMARRFTDVQDFAFSSDLPAALGEAPAMPTLVVANSTPGAAARIPWYSSLAGLPSLILVHFGSPSAVTLPKSWSWINAPLRSRMAETFVGQAVVGAESLTGKLPDGRGAVRRSVRGGFRYPEEVRIDRHRLEQADQTIQRAIRYGAAPGAQLTVLKKGEVVYERSYGFHRYDKQTPVRVSDLYDLASVTKAAATSLAVMKLYDQGRLQLDAVVSDYLPEYGKGVPGFYRIDQLLTHHTGIQPNLPIYPFLNGLYISDQPDSLHQLHISSTKWLDQRVPKLVRESLATVEFTHRPEYRYSDVNYVLLQAIVERISGESLDTFVAENFYDPMGLKRLGFRPRDHGFAEQQLIPTMVDKWMGRGEVHGFVHDEGAAVLGGVAGHAGLFGNAYDLGQLFQMLNDGGRYGGEEFLSPETVQLFTARGPYNQRALGFDRLAAGYGSVIAAGASDSTFGHTGFTGTCVWADPEHNLVFVLLTNRLYPDPANRRFFQYRTRATVHSGVYRALNTYAPPAA